MANLNAFLHPKHLCHYPTDGIKRQHDKSKDQPVAPIDFFHFHIGAANTSSNTGCAELLDPSPNQLFMTQ